MLGSALLVSCADGEAAQHVGAAIDVVDDTTAAEGSASSDPGIVDQVNGFACDADRKTLEVAVESYYAMNGEPPVDQQQLVEAGFLRKASNLFDLAAGGEIVPAAAAGCA
ncbi:MAG: hypothetical protein AB7R77_06660 [Ilumatobacteraceae bacterium]